MSTPNLYCTYWHGEEAELPLKFLGREMLLKRSVKDRGTGTPMPNEPMSAWEPLTSVQWLATTSPTAGNCHEVSVLLEDCVNSMPNIRYYSRSETLIPHFHDARGRSPPSLNQTKSTMSLPTATPESLFAFNSLRVPRCSLRTQVYTLSVQELTCKPFSAISASFKKSNGYQTKCPLT